MQTSNPTLGTFDRVGSSAGYDAMTVEGTIFKTGILAVILTTCFAVAWASVGVHASVGILIGAASIVGLILALIISFVPKTAPYLSPLYAAAEGFALGFISYLMEAAYPHIVLPAAACSLATLFAMLIAYRSGLIRVNNTFRAVIGGAMLAICLYYVVGWIASFFGVHLLGLGLEGGWLSIGISIVVVVVAALSLALDFDFIARNAGSAPKYMEWYGAFSLMVTMVWLYLEILRLMAKLRKR